MKNFKRVVAIVTLPILILALVLIPVVAIGNNIVSFLQDEDYEYFHLEDFIEIIIDSFDTYVNLFK